MTMHRVLWVLAAMVLGVPGMASAQADYTHGVICNPRAVDAAKVDYNQYGVFNKSATSAQVWCQAGYAGKHGAIAVTVYDRNNAENVCCTARVQASDGATRWSGNKCTAGFASDNMVISFTAAEVEEANGILSVQCTLPAQTANGVSVLSSVRMTAL